MGETHHYCARRPFAVIEQTGSTYGSVYLVSTDHIGRPVFSTGLSGAVVWRSEYLPFGGITSHRHRRAQAGVPFAGESGLLQALDTCPPVPQAISAKG